MTAQKDCENIFRITIYSKTTYERSYAKQVNVRALVRTYINLNPNKNIVPFSPKTLSQGNFVNSLSKSINKKRNYIKKYPFGFSDNDARLLFIPKNMCLLIFVVFLYTLPYSFYVFSLL